MYKKISILFILFFLTSGLKAIPLSAELFDYNEDKIAAEFAELDLLENVLIENPNLSLSDIALRFPQYAYMIENSQVSPLGINQISAPGNISSFWWAFSFSFVGSYFIYGAAAGPIAVAIVYFNTGKNKPETKKAIFGCLTGTVLGLGIRYVVSNL
ncbi:MAG: hypothetical protein L3J74_11920 [Bacteroidales bacterium]|nr:hypothetical protein [Bacteroidales bacterium]